MTGSNKKAPNMSRSTSSQIAVAMSLAAAIALSGIHTTSAATTKRWPSNPEFDKPEKRYPSTRRIKLLGGKIVLQRIDYSSNLLEFNPATRGVTGITLFQLVYRTNVFPIPAKSGDVQATVTIGRTIFHDGFQWKGIIGPFTSLTTAARFPCFTKMVFLPTDNPAYQIGKTVPVRITFPRTRQRITLPATITAGNINPHGGTQIDDIAALGCPIRKDPTDQGFVYGPGAFSPASLLPRRYGVPRLPR